MRFIELFAGVGGFRLGLERTGHECVFASEWLAKPASIYERNFNDKPDQRDVCTITADSLPDADLIVGGFPCATFSVAGKRTGLSLEDTRGTLFYEMFRLARDKRVPYVLFENVHGLLNHDGGQTFGVMLGVMDAMGFDAQWELLDSQNFGVPQHRERVFLVANLRGRPRPEVFPIERARRADARAQEAEESGGDEEEPSVFFARAILTPDRTAKRQNGRRMKLHNEPSFCLTAQDRHGVAVPEGVRRLTPLECERLQGLPDNWTKWYADGSLVPDAERYERCGRTVTIPIIEAIGERLHL